MNRDANGDTWSYQPYDDSGDNQPRDNKRNSNNFKKMPYKQGSRQNLNERTMMSDYIESNGKGNKFANNVHIY
jgi:hypothetical protein